MSISPFNSHFQFYHKTELFWEPPLWSLSCWCALWCQHASSHFSWALFGECARSPEIYLQAIILVQVLLHQPGGLFSSHTNVRAGHGLQFPASMPLLMVFPTVGRSLFLLPPNHRLSKTISFLQSSVQTPHPPKSLQESLSPCSLWGAWTRALRTSCQTRQPRKWCLFTAVTPAPCGAQMAPCFFLTHS